MISPAYSPLYVSSEAQQTVTYQIAVFTCVCMNVLSQVLLFVNETQETRLLAPSRGRRELDTKSVRTVARSPPGPCVQGAVSRPAHCGGARFPLPGVFPTQGRDLRLLL